MRKILEKVRIITFAAMFIMAAVVVVPTQGATVTSIVDQPGNQDAGTASNHTLLFTTPTGAPEGSTITLTFDASFDTSSIIEDDVDVADDNVDLTTAVDCTGSEQASVSMVADVLTIAICVGDGGAIAGGSEVRVEIGANASASGAGVNRITNPSSVGTYSIRLQGGFGDVGNVWIPIVTNSDVPVTATVSSSLGGGGGGDGGGGDPPSIDPSCPDTVDPVISGVSVGSVTGSGATITWNTNEGTTSIVDYGLTTSYGSTASEILSLVTSHSIALSGLVEARVYHFQVSGGDLCGNTDVDGDFTFTTLDTTPPIISNIVVSQLTATSARVSWLTNEFTTSYLDYGLTPSYGAQAFSVGPELSHTVLLTGLAEATIYHFDITAEDVANNTATSGDQKFKTLADLPPSNVSSLIATPGDSVVTLTWSNPLDLDFLRVRLVVRTDRFPTSVLDGNVIYVGSSTSYAHTSLTNGQKYFYAIFAEDLGGNFSSGALASATPIAPAEPPTEEPPIDEPPIDEPPVDEPPGEDMPPEDFPPDVILPPTGEDTVLPPSGDGSVCGNGVCELDETEGSCPLDCSIEIVSPTSGEGGVVVSDQYFVVNEMIELFPTDSKLDVLVARPITVRAYIDGVPSEASIRLKLGAGLYLMTEEDPGVFSATVTTPLQSGSMQASIISVVGEDEYTLISSMWNLKSFGYTFEVLEGMRERIGFSRVTLFQQSGGIFQVWNSSAYGQLNPQTTPQDGTFAWYVPIGNYYVVAEGSGYEPVQTAQTFVTNSIVTMQIELKREPPTIKEVLNTPAAPLSKLGAVAGIISGEIVNAIQNFRVIPEVQKGVDVAAPAVLTASVASTIVLSLGFDLFPLLQYLITSPILLFWRRRRKSWGVVYDAITKMPIDLAIVRLYRLTDGRLVQSRVTDSNGRYFFLADQGEFRISVTKKSFVFPSEYLKGKLQDGGYLDLYHGEPIRVSEENATIAANVPMDTLSAAAQHAPARIRFKRLLRSVQYIVAIGGILLALAVVILRPSIFTVAIFIFQLVVYLFVRRLAKVKKPRGWGIVHDEDTNKPISNVVVRIFEPVYNKLLATAVTDKKGRYNFLVGPNKYYARYEHKNHNPVEVRPIDYSQKTSPENISIDVDMKRKSKAE